MRIVSVKRFQIFVCLAATLGLLLVQSKSSAQTVLLDDFNRTNNNTVGLSWAETETVSPTSATVNTNMLRMGSTTAGRDFVLYDVSAMYNTVFSTNTGLLTWSFNMRQTRADPSGFDLKIMELDLYWAPHQIIF